MALLWNRLVKTYWTAANSLCPGLWGQESCLQNPNKPVDGFWYLSADSYGQDFMGPVCWNNCIHEHNPKLKSLVCTKPLTLMWSIFNMWIEQRNWIIGSTISDMNFTGRVIFKSFRVKGTFIHLQIWSCTQLQPGLWYKNKTPPSQFYALVEEMGTGETCKQRISLNEKLWGRV